MVDKQREVEIKGQKFTIEKEVEIPRYCGSPAPWRELIESMEIGESVPFSSAKEARNFSTSARMYGYKVITRKVTEKGKVITRAWRKE